MHQYRIEVFDYSEAGVPGVYPVVIRYADNHEDARVIVNEFNTQKYDNGQKRYRVVLSVLCYKNVDKDTYFAQFQA